MKKKKNNNIIAIITVLALFFYGLYYGGTQDSYGLDANNISNTSGKLKVTFVDVGQADCILIQEENKNMLIDAGNNEDGNKLVKYFNSLNIHDFEYIVGTHPHEDHIGGLDDVINNFDVKTIYMPDVITTTKTFEDVIDAADKKNLSITIPKIGDTFKLENATIKIIYTGTDATDLNNTSIVLKLIYGNTSFLFTGDATSKVEEQILNSNVEATVLKVGHHGSKYSSTNDFLKKVNPKYAVISVGNGNSYGHPADTTINKLNRLGINIYRTDELGSIIMISDGNNIEISNNKTDTNGD